MTAQEARQIVALLRAAYPMKSVPAETLKLYESQLTTPRLHYEIAHEAVLELVNVEKFWPSVAEVMTAYREVSARRRTQEPSPALPEPSQEEREQTLAAMREFMAGIGRPMVVERNTVESWKPVDADRNGHDPDADIPL